tara:strand:- start:2844 stop:3056 length:213 start_codon:yes stop_codon:yes gene_type:complete
MKTKNTNDYRDEVVTHLKYIKEKVDANHDHLEKVNGRLREAEKSISWMKGIGATVTFTMATLVAWLKTGE